MPELPEVEFARRQLQRWLGGATIDRAVVTDGRVVDGEPAALQRGLAGRRVLRVDRRGKWLRLRLDAGKLFSHLGMTGKWVRSDEPVRFERVRLEVHKGARRAVVRYLDPRLFGRLELARDDIAAWTSLGPDPLHDGVEVARLHERLQKRRGPIKPVLLDQGLLAGVGNIQSMEALFLARIDPRRAARSLDRREVGRLARAIERSIQRTLDAERGDSIVYVEEPGGPNPFLIYDRQGEPCPRCKTKLRRLAQAGRGTIYCPRCQR